MSVVVEGRRVAPGQGAPGESGAFTYTVVVAGRYGERRSTRRIPTRLHDAVLATRGRPLMECRIRDRSGAGARLRLDAPHPLPARFLLTDAASRSRFWATLAWQHGRDAGVRLVPA